MKQKVLLADDSPTALAVATAFLESNGYQVVQARDGLEAIDLACTESPDVVVLDVEMPRMNGYHVCRLLKMDERTSHLPVIMLTSRDLPADRYWGLQTGANCYVTKEQPLANVVQAMATLLDGRESRFGPKQRGGGLLIERDPIGLLSALNGILDRKLYEATILGEVSRLAWSTTDPRKTAEGIMELLAKLFDFSLAAMLLGDDKSNGAELFWMIRSRLSDEVLAANERIVFSALEEKCGVKADSRGLRRWKVMGAGAALPAVPESSGESIVRAVPLGSREQGGGVFVVWGRGRAWQSAESVEMVETLAHAASVVLDHARLYQEMQRLATTDGLTGLANYRQFQDTLERELDRSRRTGEPMAVIIMDLDNFKTINDSLGHKEGDLVLKSVASALSRGARPYDLVARYGGEEFAAVLPSTGRDGAQQAAERFRLLVRSVGARMKIDGLSLSLGVAVSRGGSTSNADALVQDADEALYRAKAGGKNRVCMSA